MNDIIFTLGKLSLQGSVVILVVFAIRFLFDKLNMPKKYISVLWFVPFICLILPWRIESDLSLWQFFEAGNEAVSVIENGNNTEENNEINNEIYNEINIGAIENQVNSNNSVSSSVQDVNPENSADNEDIVDKQDNLLNSTGAVQDTTNSKGVNKISAYDILCVVWLLGVFGIAIYSVVDYIRIRHLVKININIDNNVYCAEKIKVPFLLGVFKPRIYVPINIEKEQARWIIEHENTHIYRMDPVKKVLVYMITCVHWFNPIVWLGFWFFGKDMEMACDEETVKRLGEEHKQEYATVLLGIASKKGISKLSVFPAFGGGEIKERICNVLKNKKTMGIMSAAVVLLVVAMAMVFLTDGADAKEQDSQSVVDNELDSETITQEDVSTTDNESFEKETTNNEGSEQETTEINNSEPVEQVEFTTETFLKLCDEGGFHDEFKYQGMEGKLKYSNFIEERSDDNTYSWYYRCPFVYKDKDFEFRVYYTIGEGIAADDLLIRFEVLSIEREESYTFLNGNDFSALFDLMENGDRPEHYMNVELPDELDESKWEKFSYSSSGFVYDKDYKKVDKSDTCDASHYAPAGIGWLPTDGHAEFDENDRLLYVYYRNNYSHTGEDKEYIEGCQMQAVLSTVYAELFIPEYGENGKVNTYDKFIAENGREPEKTTMEYWYVFLAEPDEEYCYFVYLNKDYFTKEDAIKMAQSVRIVDWE